MGTAIAIFSGKGGVGKTTITTYLGISLSQLNKKVLVIDENFGLRNLDLLLGLENDVILTFSDIISGKYAVDECVIPHPDFEYLYFLTCSQTKSSISISEPEMERLINDLKESFDYILIDTASGIERGLELGLMGLDEAIVVSDMNVLSLRNTSQLLFLLRSKGIRFISMILNHVKIDDIKNGKALSYTSYSEIIQEDLIGIIPYNTVIESLLFNEQSYIDLPEEIRVLFQEIALRVSHEIDDFADTSIITMETTEEKQDEPPKKGLLRKILNSFSSRK